MADLLGHLQEKFETEYAFYIYYVSMGGGGGGVMHEIEITAPATPTLYLASQVYGSFLRVGKSPHISLRGILGMCDKGLLTIIAQFKIEFPISARKLAQSFLASSQVSAIFLPLTST